MIKEVKEIKETIKYESSITGYRYDTYEAAYNVECICFTRDIVENHPKYINLNENIFKDYDLQMFKINNKEELDMFIIGFSDMYMVRLEKSDLENNLKDITNFPCVLYALSTEEIVYTENKLLGLLHEAIADISTSSRRLINGQI